MMVFRAHGRFVDSLGGRAYIWQLKDGGTSDSGDMDFVPYGDPIRRWPNRSFQETLLRSRPAVTSFEPSRPRPNGAGIRMTWLGGCDILIQALPVMWATIWPEELSAVGAKLVVSDMDARTVVKRVVDDFQRKSEVKPRRDRQSKKRRYLRSTCALGGIINDKTIPQLKVEIVAGACQQSAAEEKRHGDELGKRDILYAPDAMSPMPARVDQRPIANWPDGTRNVRSAKADEIYDTLLSVFAIAKADQVPLVNLAARHTGGATG